MPKQTAVPLQYAIFVSDIITAVARKHGITAITCGSVRRKRPNPGDLDIVVVDALDDEGDFIDFGDILEHEKFIMMDSETRSGQPDPTRSEKTKLERIDFTAKLLTKTPNRKQIISFELTGLSADKYAKIPVYADLFYVYNDELPYALMHYTGSKMYNIRIRAHVKKLGYLLNQYGLFDIKTGERAKGTEKIKTEKQLCEFIGITYKDPPDREN